MLWLLAAEFPTPWVAGGASVVLFMALVTALVRMNTLSTKQIDTLRDTQGTELKRQGEELVKCREDFRLCEQRHNEEVRRWQHQVNILIWAMQKAEIEVPPEIWQMPREQ